MWIEHRQTGDKRDLEVIDVEPQSRKVILRWPLFGYLEFCIDTGVGKGKTAKAWYLTKQSMVEAKELLKTRLKRREDAIGSGNTSGQ